MNIQTLFRDAAQTIRTAHPELTATVVSGGQSAVGLLAAGTDSAALADMGEMGTGTRKITVAADAIAKPALGATITVGGVAAFVLSVEADAAGAFWVIEYQAQKPK